MAQLRVTTASLSNITTSNSIFTNHTNLALHSNGNLLDKLQQLQLPVAAAPSSQWQLHFLNPTTINSSTPWWPQQLLPPMQCQQPKHNNFSPCNETSNNESTASFLTSQHPTVSSPTTPIWLSTVTATSWTSYNSFNFQLQQHQAPNGSCTSSTQPQSTLLHHDGLNNFFLPCSANSPSTTTSAPATRPATTKAPQAS